MSGVIPIIEVTITKDQFSTYRKIFPAHELPIFVSDWGNEHIEVIGKTENPHEFEDVPGEVNRLLEIYGPDKLKSVFGSSFADGIEMSINRILDKEKALNGSKNTAESKN
tara:strand:- start:906 stop:1235 length:330 start_codon:yes stop_codon:yes gene_type:complete